MGKLRLEPKVKPLLNAEEYEQYNSVLQEALSASSANHVYWDLESGEKPQAVRKAFLYVAEKEGIGLQVRTKRDSNSLTLKFSGSASRPALRMSASEAEERILGTLRKARSPLSKSEIVQATGISPSTWNIRIKELLEKGSVVRHGKGRDTQYASR